MVLGEKTVPERYPLNANQCLITNIFLAYPFYIVPVFFPHVIWLGIAQMLFGLSQFIIYGIVINIRLKSFYNPGLAAVVLLHVPIGVYYLWYISANHLASTGDVVIGILVTVLAALIIVVLPMRLLASKASPYPFSEAEMGGFAKQKVAKIRMSETAR